MAIYIKEKQMKFEKLMDEQQGFIMRMAIPKLLSKFLSFYTIRHYVQYEVEK